MNPRITTSPDTRGGKPKRSSMRAVALLACALLTGSPAAFAAPGDIDPTFGAVLRSVGTGYPDAWASALQSDGKILVAGDLNNGASTNPQEDMALIRQDTNGSSDSTFGGGAGGVITHVGSSAAGYQNTINGVVELPNGSIEAAGWGLNPGCNCYDAALVRYQANGTLDPTFAGGGSEFLTFSNASSKSHAIALLSNLKSVIAGYVQVGTANPQLMVARFTSTGALDTTFGTGGAFVLPTSVLSWSDGYSVAIQADGKILIGGKAILASSPTYASTVVVRLTSNGVLDTTFNSVGYVSWSEVFDNGSLAIQPDGKIDVVPLGGRVTRLNPNGSLDTSFGGGGTAIDTSSYGSNITLLPTGQILLATAVFDDATQVSSFQVTRFTAQGALDTSFNNSSGQSGIVTTSFNLGSISLSHLISAAGGIALGPDGRFTVSGNATINTTAGYFLMARYAGNPLVLKPTAATFTNVTGVPVSTVQVSNVITVSGLTAGAFVPLTVSANGKYSINGGPWVATLGYVQNGDKVMVDQTSAAISGASVKTSLVIGGLYALNNHAVNLGGSIVASFTSTTK